LQWVVSQKKNEGRGTTEEKKNRKGVGRGKGKKFARKKVKGGGGVPKKAKNVRGWKKERGKERADPILFYYKSKKEGYTSVQNVLRKGDVTANRKYKLWEEYG